MTMAALIRKASTTTPDSAPIVKQDVLPCTFAENISTHPVQPDTRPLCSNTCRKTLMEFRPQPTQTRRPFHSVPSLPSIHSACRKRLSPTTSSTTPFHSEKLITGGDQARADRLPSAITPRTSTPSRLTAPNHCGFLCFPDLPARSAISSLSAA